MASGTNQSTGRQSKKQNVCSRCEALPEKSTESDQLYLWPPLQHSTAKLTKALRSKQWNHNVQGDTISIELEEDIGSLLLLISETLSSTEIADTRCLLKNHVEKLSVQHIPRARSFDSLYATHEAEWLIRMIEDARFTSHFQPIVHAERPTEVFGYEGLLRGLDAEGSLVSPGEIFQVAKKADLLFQTDLAARRTMIDEARFHGIQNHLFVNFTPTSIYDPVYCLRSTVRLIDETNIAHEKVVFEVTESEDLDDTEHLLNIIDYYKSTGFKVALDDVGSGYSSLNLLHRLKPDFIKLDMQLIHGVTKNPYKATVAQKLLEMARDLGTETVVEGVESEEELAWAQEYGATFVQGYLIARPSSPPPTLNHLIV